MSRRVRSVAALLALFAFVFANFATAAYACPQLLKMAPATAGAVHDGDCDHGANPDPNLCQRHCDDGKVSLETQKTFNPPVMAATFVRAVEIPILRSNARAPKFARVGTGPPPTRFTVLRI
jgi:hypothetical protein